jgi:RNA polymerase sigma factor (sigma-70 family)
MGRSQLSDEDVALVQAGEKKAWDRFVEKFAGLVYAASWRTIRMKTERASEEDAKDAAQEVFLRLVRDDFRLLKTYNPEKASLSTWLTIVARSTAIDHLRRHAPKAKFTPLDEDMPDETARGISDAFDGGLLGDLPPGLLSEGQRRVLTMLYEEDLDVAEAAAALNVQAQTVRSLKHQALTRLRAHYGVHSDRVNSY